MSYGCSVCARCGGEVRVYEGDGGTCPNCGAWVSAGTHDEIQEAIDREKKRQNEIDERMKHVTRIVVECSEADDDRIRRWSKEFTDIEEAKEWAIKQYACCDILYYDEKGLIW